MEGCTAHPLPRAGVATRHFTMRASPGARCWLASHGQECTLYLDPCGKREQVQAAPQARASPPWRSYGCMRRFGPTLLEAPASAIMQAAIKTGASKVKIRPPEYRAGLKRVMVHDRHLVVVGGPASGATQDYVLMPSGRRFGLSSLHPPDQGDAELPYRTLLTKHRQISVAPPLQRNGCSSPSNQLNRIRDIFDFDTNWNSLSQTNP